MDQFHHLFAKLDQNNDGFISIAELQDEMRKHGILSSNGKMQVKRVWKMQLWGKIQRWHVSQFVSFKGLVDSYDKNKDGLLDYEEFLCYMMDRERKWKIYFHDLDKNKCGESFFFAILLWLLTVQNF